MNRKGVIILVATVLIFALGIQAGLSKEKEKTALDTDRVIRKLDEVLANQAEILKQFEEIKQELQVIKVRATR